MTIYNDFDPADEFDRLLMHDDRIVQSREANVLQSMQRHRLAGLMDVLFRQGDIISGAMCITDAHAGTARLEAGALYIDAAKRQIGAALLDIPTEGNVYVGAYLQRKIVTHLEDPRLKNPAIGTYGWDKPGADREKISLLWGLKDDGTPGEFFPVWLIEDGVVRPKEPPPNIDAVTQALIRYDVESTGSNYVVQGLNLLQGDDLPDGRQVYTLKSGSAKINGVGVRLSADRRIIYDAQPDLQWIDSEPHASAGPALQTIMLDRWPVVGAVQARITVRRVVEMVHGGFIGAADPLPDNAVIEVESITQGATAYLPGVSWNLVAGQIDWSPPGPEPAPGNTYQVTYKCNIVAAIQSQTERSIQLEGALAGTQVLVSYHFALRRYDRLVLNTEGFAQWVHGVSSAFRPLPPGTPSACLSIAVIYQSWDSDRRVIDERVRMMSMAQLNRGVERMDNMEVAIATLSLAVDVSGRYAGVQRGRYADPLIDNSMRDAGTPQTAAIANGALQLPTVITAHTLGQNVTSRIAVAGAAVAAISQPLRSGKMKVNPYLAFDVMPSDTVLTPAVDRWTQTDVHYISPLLESFFDDRSSGAVIREMRRESVDTVVSEKTTVLEFLRAIDIAFACKMHPGEHLKSLSFDGIPVNVAPLAGAALVADAHGMLRGTFTVPQGVPAGTKDVVIVGTGGSFGIAQFTGQGTLIEMQRQQVIKVWTARTDPLAQTFTMAQTRQAIGFKFWATDVGGELMVQLREVENGYPTRTVLAECYLQPQEIKTDGQPTVAQWPPTLLDGGREYCTVILANDADSAVAVAELGEWDVTGKHWITSQPYTVGVLLSSSNNSTWTAHQKMDMAFELLTLECGGATRTVELGSADVENASDLMVNAFAHEPAVGADCSFEMTLTGTGQVLRVAPGQVKQLTERYTGAVAVRALLSSTATLSAALEPGITLLAASLQPQGDYISPWITADATRPCTLRVLIEASLPGGSGVIVQCQTEGQGDWSAVPYQSTSHPTVGVLENTYQAAIGNTGRVRVRLTLSGSINARPKIANLRAVVLES